jgi:hypothetical protein
MDGAKIIFPSSPFYLSIFFRSHKTRFTANHVRATKRKHIKNATKNIQKRCVTMIFEIQEQTVIPKQFTPPPRRGAPRSPATAPIGPIR